MHTHTHANRKALGVTDFPNEAVINEYLTLKDRIPHNHGEVLTWQFPQVHSAQAVCHRLMEWPFDYTHNKVISFMTQWCLRKKGVAEGVGTRGLVSPQR